MNTRPGDDQLFDRVARYCDGLLAGEELAEFDRLLHEDSVARQKYLMYVEVHAELVKIGLGNSLERFDPAAAVAVAEWTEDAHVVDPGT